MNHHVRSGIAIFLVLAFLGISWFIGHRPANWEYVFLMFVMFSSALQDAIDDVKERLGEASSLLKKAARKADHLDFVVRQQAEYLQSDVSRQTDLLLWKIDLMNALQTGEPAPEAPPFREAKFVGEPPTLDPFDARKWREERVRKVATALGDYSWWDMAALTIPIRQLVVYIVSRPGFIRWISG